MGRLGLIALICLAATLSACGENRSRPDEVIAVLDRAGEPAAAPAPVLAGRWETVLETSVDPRPLVLTIDLSGPEPQVVLTAPNQGGAQIAFAQVRLDGDQIGFATPLGALRFEGRLDGQDAIIGEVHQGGFRSALTWRRAG